MQNVTFPNGIATTGPLVVGGTTKFGGIVLTWPIGAGSTGQVLTTDGTGNLSWTTPQAGQAGITQQQADLRYKAISYVPAWSELTGVPASFPPASHALTAHTGTLADAQIPSNIARRDAAGAWAGAQMFDAFVAHGEVLGTPVVSAGTLALDLAQFSAFRVALGASITTLTITNPIGSGKVSAFTLTLDVSASVSVVWPAAVKWSGGTAPTLTSGKAQTLTFYTTDGGTTWVGFDGGAA